MRKKKPFKIIEERSKNNYIVIQVFRRYKIFSYGLSISIGYGGMAHPESGAYPSFFEAKNTALKIVKKFHKSKKEQAILKKFRIMADLDQPLLFYD
jgi:hypothetical protein